MQYPTGQAHPLALQPEIRIQDVVHYTGHGVVFEITGPFIILFLPLIGVNNLYIVNWRSGNVLIVRFLSSFFCLTRC